MPIKPENRHRYPADWSEIRLRVLQRAGSRCEHVDEGGERCSAVHRALGYWRQVRLMLGLPGQEQVAWEVWRWTPLPRTLRDAGVDKPMTIASCEGPLKIVQIVLTVAHLDHQPENCDDANLRAWCQRHHLAYDAEHHRITAAATRRARANTLEMF